MKIGILSDTHNLLRPEVIDCLQGCEVILHAGDICKPEILKMLGKIAPVYAVSGNADKEWEDPLPVSRQVAAAGLSIVMAHKKKDLPADLQRADLVIFGHSHRYEDVIKDGVRFFNPGSCGPRRFRQPITLAILEAEDGAIMQIRKIDISNKAGASTAEPQIPGDMKRLIEKAMTDIEKGKSSAQIAGKYGISEELSETICRLYLTHPGVDAEGIMTKMGL